MSHVHINISSISPLNQQCANILYKMIPGELSDRIHVAYVFSINKKGALTFSLHGIFKRDGSKLKIFKDLEKIKMV